MQLMANTRLKRSPFFDATIAAGATSFTVYNHMLMPTSYGDPDAEYWHIINDASLWDVSVQVQVEIAGPDADKLAQAVVCRDLTNVVIGQARYAPMLDHAGNVMNDPVALRVDDNRWWLSLGDSDMLYWCRGIAAERGFDVEICQPDVSPLAVQGPKAVDVVADLVGDWVRDLGRFRYKFYELAVTDGRPMGRRHEPLDSRSGTDTDVIPLWVGRAGWSKQGGYELYLLDGSKGTQLWDLVVEAGKPYGMGLGSPNAIERLESFLLSYGGDTLADNDPFELRLGKFVDLDSSVDFIGRDALLKRREAGLKRELVGLKIDGEPLAMLERPIPVKVGDDTVGTVKAAIWSPRCESNIALALVDVPHNQLGTKVSTHHENGTDNDVRSAEVVDLPFIAPGPAA